MLFIDYLNMCLRNAEFEQYWLEDNSQFATNNFLFQKL